ncbi:MAG: PEGA domain-containing protein [Deltaproteobacteria bacterium]|nr:PEGA domain-containing protein [Deltaproteobacteria bacterium]
MIRTLLILLWSLVAWAPAARADAGVGVVVMGDATIQPQLAAQFEDWLRHRGTVLVPSPLPADAINSLIDCFVVEDMTCARKVVEQKSKTPQMVFVKVDLSDAKSGMRDVTITAYWFEIGVDPVAVRRECTSCTDAAMRIMTDNLMSLLAGKTRAEIGQITLTTTPAGARVVIDGTAVGLSPVTHSLSPGPHIVTISSEGHANETRSVTIERGETAAVDVQLVRAAPTRRLPLIALGLGGAMVLTGIVLYATSEEDTGEKPEYRETRALGVTLGVVGLAAAGVGAYLLLRGGDPAEGPRVAIVPGGGFIGWGTQF